MRGNAITIHKAQGLSLDAVDLHLASGCFAHGQLYTALSRCRTLEGLRLDRSITSDDLIVDPTVCSFYEAMRSIAQPPAQTFVKPPYYEEAMRYYLNSISPKKIDNAAQQFEFDFASRVSRHPAIDRLLSLANSDGFSKYDAPVLLPLVEACSEGRGLTDDQLKTVQRILAKYDRDGAVHPISAHRIREF